MASKAEKLNIKHFWANINGDGSEDEKSITLTKSDLTFIHALLSDAFDKVTSDKYHNAIHRYTTDLWEINKIIYIEKEIWGALETPNNAREIIQSFLDAKREWVHKHADELNEEEMEK